MPSFGLPSSMPPSSSSPSPLISSILSSNVNSCSESSCPPVPDGCLSHLFESPYVPPPPPLSIADAASYSPPPAYPPAFPFGLPLLSSARFPPPPNSSFVQPIPNITFFDGPHSHYPPEPHTAYDRWSDRNIISIPYGSDDSSKRFSHWPLPTFNSSVNNSSNDNDSSAGFLKPEPIFPSLAPYPPPIDSVLNFGPKFLPGFPRDPPAFPNATVMPSNSSPSITSSLASGFFSAFPSPNVPMDFPLSSARPPFTPHPSAFIPGMDTASAFGPCNAEFIPDPVPSCLSRTGAFLPSSSFQAPDHFHDASSRPIHSPETAPRPLRSNSPSCFFGHHPHSLHGPSTPNGSASLSLSSRSNNAPDPLCSTDGAAGLEPSFDFPPPSVLPYPPPLSGTLFCPYSSPVVYQDLVRNGGVPFSPQREEERAERIVSDAGKLIYQHMSPEEWRWKYYEPMYADALDQSSSFARVRLSGYNHFHGADCNALNSSSSLVGNEENEEGSSLGDLESQKEQYIDVLERSKAQNHPGPSLKLAASALAEMLALGSNEETNLTSRSMLAQIASSSGTGLTSDASFPLVSTASGGQARSERMLDDCCSSSGSAVVPKEGGDGSFSHKFEELTAEGYSSGLNLYSPSKTKPESPGQLEDAFCDFRGAPAAWALPNAPGQSQCSANPRPMSWGDGVPQSAKGGALHAPGQRRVFSKGSAGIMRQPSMSHGSAKLHGMNAVQSSMSENINNLFTQSSNLISENFNHFNNLLTQSSNLSSRPQSGRMRNVSSQPVGALSSEDNPFGVGPFGLKVTLPSGLSVCGPHQEVPSSGLGSQLPLDSSHGDQWHVKSTSCGSSPPISQAHLDPHGSASGQTSGVASRVLANLKWGCPDNSSQTEVANLGTGIHSLTMSISNLSKVLFSLNSSALTQPDSVVMEQSLLQSSILRLSQCLLLEQSRMNRNPATPFVGSDESSASRQGRVDGSFTELNVVRCAEPGGSTNLGHLKASETGILTGTSRSGSPAHLCSVNNLSAAADITPLEAVHTGGSGIHSRSFHRTLPFDDDSYSVSKCSVTNGETRAGKDYCHNYHNGPEQSPSPQQQGASVPDDVLELLRYNDILDCPSLKRLIGAEAREAKLKVLVEELREELELERVENRGTAFLCEKIMQEAEVSKAKAVMQGAEKADSIKSGNLECNVQCNNRTVNGQSKFKMHGKKNCSVLEEELGSFSKANNSDEPFLNNIDQVEPRLEFLQARPSASATENLNISRDISRRELGGKMVAAMHEDVSEDAIRNNTEQLESRLPLLAQPEATAPLNTSHDMSRSVQSRLAVLQARSVCCTSETSADSCPAATIQESSFDSLEALVQLQAQPEPTDSSSSHDWPGDIDEGESQPAARQTTSPHDALKDIDHMEARLALLQTRPGWDNELGVFTETEPCTPANPAGVDMDIARDGRSGSTLHGLHEEQVDFTAKALDYTISHFTSELLIQSEILSNMQTGWNQLSEQVNPENLEMESKTEPPQNEADMKFSTTFTQAYDDSQAVEARALLIRSRSDQTEGDELEAETEDCLGGQICKVTSTSSGCVRYESDQFETLRDISLVRLLDSEVETSHLLPVKNTTVFSSIGGATGNTSMVESSKSGEGSLATVQDTEEDSGWEHVSLPLEEVE